MTDERALLERLDAAIYTSDVRAFVDGIAERVARNLAANPNAGMAWESIPLEVHGTAVPGVIQSSWVFILRAGRATGAERHPNSVQRMFSYRGVGDMQTSHDGSVWTSHRMVSDGVSPLDQRWLSIPVNTWHQAVVAPDEDWVVVSFHSVPADDLIEERPDPKTKERRRQRRYAEEAGKSW